LAFDEEQELKEAVCDAVLERTRRVVSGEGEFGRVIYGAKPSATLTSAFLLPGRTVDGDDVASDINISIHGVDFHLDGGTNGVLRLKPVFNVYVRTLPQADEVFDPRLGLRPKPMLGQAAQVRFREAVKRVTRSAGFKELSVAERKAERLKVRGAFFKELGVTVDPEAVREREAAGAGEEIDDDDGLGVIAVDGQDTRIPDEHARRHPIPERYMRLAPQLPVLEIALPLDLAKARAAIHDYEGRLNEAVSRAYLDWMDSPEGSAFAWRDVSVPGSSFWSKEHWEQRLADIREASPRTVDLLPDGRLGVLFDATEIPLQANTLAVRFALENRRGGIEKAEDGVFQVHLALELPTAALRQMPMERVRRSYQFAGFLEVPAIGVNGGVDHRTQGETSRLTTTWCPRHVLPRMRPSGRANVQVEFASLADRSFDPRALLALPEGIASWVDEVDRTTDFKEPHETVSELDLEAQRLRFQEDLKAWRSEGSRIRKGIETLVRARDAYLVDPKSMAAAPFEAWLLLNQTFRKATKNPGWRLFQMGFILTHVPTLVSRVPGYEDVFDFDFDEGSASLLYMATGGGKSEAFFGVLVYALFLDRLRGKRRGVTAMLHYPLRLLTLQQARRLMRLMAKAELIRNDNGLGGAQFELGFWVGGSNTPNSIGRGGSSVTQEARCIPETSTDPFLKSEDRFLAERADYAARNDAWNKIPDCPFCNARTGLRIYPQERNRLGIVCEATECDWNRRHDTKHGRRPLPFLIVDMDIYQRSPSVLLGTIDKLALVGNTPQTINRIAGMFGLARFVEGGDDDGLLLSPLKGEEVAAVQTVARPLHPAFGGGHRLFIDPLPSLIIQDEMHLLEESLGTFGGIFETTLFAMFAGFAKLHGAAAARVPGIQDLPRMPHVIGATATAADADRQMQHLYQRKAVQFPHPGPKLYSSFYTELEVFDGEAGQFRNGKQRARDQEASAPWGRVYASLLTNGKPHTSATLEILSAHAVGITRWARDLVAQDPSRRRRACDEMIGSLSGGELSARHAAAIARAREASSFELLVRLVDLHRIMLTYVTNKKGGDQLMSALDREVRKRHDLEGADYALSSFDIELISGGVDIKGIQSVIRKAESARDPIHVDVDQSMRLIVATSAISHGVDVDAFNAMTFAGVPSDIAEYIQASSRVGRTHVGFSLLIPTPQNRRDRYVLDNHQSYHRFLERMISPPAIERWADKAIRRTLPSLMQAYLFGVLLQTEFCAADDGSKRNVSVMDTPIKLRQLLVGPNAAAKKAALLDFLEQAIGLQAQWAKASTPEHYRNLLRGWVDQVASEIQNNKYGDNLRIFWEEAAGVFGGGRPMSSLRDVDEGGLIRGDNVSWSGRARPVTPSEIREAMDFIMRRPIAGRRSSGEASELSSEMETDDA
jgi:hypothetical protein